MSPTSLVRLPENLTSGKEVFAFQQQFNPTGSMKDKMVSFVLDKALETGELKARQLIVEASSGNTGAALSKAGVDRGHEVHIFLADTVSKEKKDAIARFGGIVHEVPTYDSPQLEVEQSREFAAKRKGYLFDQFSNPYHTEGYVRNLWPELLNEIVDQKISVDTFFGGIGSGASCIAIGKGLKEIFKNNLKIYGVVPEHFPSDIEGLHPAHKSALGEFDIWKNRPTPFETEVLKVKDEDAFLETIRLNDSHFEVGPGSGAVLSVAKRLGGKTSLIVFCDHSRKYKRKIKDWRQKFEADLRLL